MPLTASVKSSNAEEEHHEASDYCNKEEEEEEEALQVHHSLSQSLQEMNINATLGLGALEE
jgi:hypothetical protein